MSTCFQLSLANLYLAWAEMGRSNWAIVSNVCRLAGDDDNEDDNDNDDGGSGCGD